MSNILYTIYVWTIKRRISIPCRQPAERERKRQQLCEDSICLTFSEMTWHLLQNLWTVVSTFTIQCIVYWTEFSQTLSFSRIALFCWFVDFQSCHFARNWVGSAGGWELQLTLQNRTQSASWDRTLTIYQETKGGGNQQSASFGCKILRLRSESTRLSEISGSELAHNGDFKIVNDVRG